MNAVFPDSSNITQKNGGFSDKEDLKKQTLEDCVSPTADTTELLLARGSTNALRDYEGNNLMKAFTNVFPFGTGWLDLDMEEQSGVEHLQCPMTLSNPCFHKAEFVLVTHNMFERKRLVSASHVRVDDAEKCLTGKMNNESMADAIDDHLGNESGNAPADTF